MIRGRLRRLPRPVRRLIVSVMGGTVFLLGVVMLVTPGPALLVMPAGLAILSLEFVWARRLLKRYKSAARNALGAMRARKKEGVPEKKVKGAPAPARAAPGTVPCSGAPSAPRDDRTRMPGA